MKTFMYIANKPLSQKVEEDFHSIGVRVVQVSDQCLGENDDEREAQIKALIEEFKPTHVESSSRYLEAMLFEVAQKMGVVTLSSIYRPTPLPSTKVPVFIGVGEISGLNVLPEDDEGDVIIENIKDSYLSHFA